MSRGHAAPAKRWKFPYARAQVTGTPAPVAVDVPTKNRSGERTFHGAAVYRMERGVMKPFGRSAACKSNLSTTKTDWCDISTDAVCRNYSACVSDDSEAVLHGSERVCSARMSGLDRPGPWGRNVTGCLGRMRGEEESRDSKQLQSLTGQPMTSSAERRWGDDRSYALLLENIHQGQSRTRSGDGNLSGGIEQGEMSGMAAAGYACVGSGEAFHMTRFWHMASCEAGFRVGGILACSDGSWGFRTLSKMDTVERLQIISSSAERRSG
ncbi:hypothetical protein K491DRAFT_683717 [Lophiostoma macrostomum CBS 122681]|uniref:Uncharacterized protein n=1 Tax=Lophiostoma macrostomum CBS 122681 TaxID=1314788 RepID=A0A6A6STR8_9PLEO|nr:hypothetical protein K491DRAFT_683717 [Lophiostoma macrostomum CBS 122681]